MSNFCEIDCTAWDMGSTPQLPANKSLRFSITFRFLSHLSKPDFIQGFHWISLIMYFSLDLYLKLTGLKSYEETNIF